MITIVDYGLSNLRSVQKAFQRIGIETVTTNKKDVISRAEKLVLPGVGHFAVGMQRLRELDLIEALNKRVVSEKTPVLGICLGMQLMTRHSEEGNCDGLGWVDAETRKFSFHGEHERLKIPHMGWNTVKAFRGGELLSGVEEDNSFYFVHSFYVICDRAEDILSTTSYGLEFHSGVQFRNVIGVQFHPEKSHDAGLNLLKKFAVM